MIVHLIVPENMAMYPTSYLSKAPRKQDLFSLGEFHRRLG